jgi:soluble lytic murein transglycosylase-like protein
MDRVTLLLLGALAVGPIPGAVPAYAEPVAPTDAALDPWQDFIVEASRRFGLPEAWIRLVMQAESGGRTMVDDRPIASRAGAIGLMQVMPDTYEEMRRAHGLGPDPHDPRNNILAGTAYLRAMYDRYGYPGLFAAYNAGPARYNDHVLHGRALPAETRAYLVRSRRRIQAHRRLLPCRRERGCSSRCEPPPMHHPMPTKCRHPATCSSL